MNNEAIPRLLFLIIIVVLGILLHNLTPKKIDREKKRRDDLAALAQKLKLHFSPGTDFKLADRFSFLSLLNRGDVRSAYNVSHGDHKGFPVLVFDYEISSGKYDYYWSAYIIEMNTNFPDTLITRETLGSRLFESMGESHITFESKDFSRAYNVRAADKEFAFDVCHSKMMEYLLANRDLIIEIRGGAILLLFEDWLRPEKVEFNLSRLIEIRKLLPQYLFTT